MAWIDTPVSAAKVGSSFEVTGWAFKNGVGLDRVEVTLDGAPVAQAQYGLDNPGVARYWQLANDPNQPRVGFRASVDASSETPGRHRLGLARQSAVSGKRVAGR